MLQTLQFRLEAWFYCTFNDNQFSSLTKRNGRIKWNHYSDDCTFPTNLCFVVQYGVDRCETRARWCNDVAIAGSGSWSSATFSAQNHHDETISPAIRGACSSFLYLVWFLSTATRQYILIFVYRYTCGSLANVYCKLYLQVSNWYVLFQQQYVV